MSAEEAAMAKSRLDLAAAYNSVLPRTAAAAFAKAARFSDEWSGASLRSRQPPGPDGISCPVGVNPPLVGVNPPPVGLGFRV
jgi:hypothetical protein